MTAPNPGPFTLGGTRSYLVGRRDVLIIDPGPDVDSHVRALAYRVRGADSVRLVLTHGHADHAASAARLSADVDAEVLGPPDVDAVTRVLGDGDRVESDDGELVAFRTPGHTREHLALHWPDHGAVFVGDLLLGRGDTTWVAEYPGCVADYLDSLDRVRALDAEVLYPTHGPPLTDPADALDRFTRHRLERVEQVRRARRRHPDADVEALVDAVYGDTVPSSMRGAARKSLEAVLHHLEAHD